MSALPLAAVESYRAPAPVRECIAVRDMTDCLIEAYDCVARLAYQKFVARGSRAGGELDDWLNAEHELLDKLSVHIEDSGDFIHALVSIPGAHGSQVKIGIESRWLVIVSHRDSDSDRQNRPLTRAGPCLPAHKPCTLHTSPTDPITRIGVFIVGRIEISRK